jgi:hypothetical protein
LDYYIKKRVITDNLYGVDIMEEAVEIAKLRLFLSLVASAETVDDLEPLPNVDFNIMSGNSLIGLIRVDDQRFDYMGNPDILQQLKAKDYQGILKEKNESIKMYKEHAFIVGKVEDTEQEDRLQFLVKRTVNLKTSNKTLGALIDCVWTKEVNNQYEAQTIFEKFLAEGQEGTILKSKTNIWEDKRSKEQIKFKGELECDLVVVDWEEGTGKNVGRLGALVCESSDGLIQVNVGSGYSDEQRKEFTKQAVIGKILTVKYNARIKDRGDGVERLFLPTFIEMREDKDVADSSKKIK